MAGRRSQIICQVELALLSFKLPEAGPGVMEALRELLVSSEELGDGTSESQIERGTWGQ